MIALIEYNILPMFTNYKLEDTVGLLWPDITVWDKHYRRNAFESNIYIARILFYFKWNVRMYEFSSHFCSHIRVRQHPGRSQTLSRIVELYPEIKSYTLSKIIIGSRRTESNLQQPKLNKSY